MASRKAVAVALAALARNFAGDVSEEKADLWLGALKDVSDEALGHAVVHVIKTHTGEFIPPVGVLRNAAGANVEPALDVDGILEAIARLGSYSGRWWPPRPETVARHASAEVARAYAEIGGTALYSDNPTTREIAHRDFVRALRAARDEAPAPAVAQLGAGAMARELAAGAGNLLQTGLTDRTKGG